MFRSQIRGARQAQIGPRVLSPAGRRSSDHNSYWRRLATGIALSPIGRRVQTQPEVGAPDESYERQADAVADQVMRMPEPSGGQARTMEEEREEPSLQRKPEEKSQENVVGNQTPAIQAKQQSTTVNRRHSGLAGSVRRLTHGGVPLPTSARAYFEPRFGHDFTSVRVHTGAPAAAAAKQFQAKAFTFGNHIVFGDGHYRPEADSGRRLLAHELTHVIQQRGGSTPSVQCQPEGASGGLSEPNVGSVTFRFREDGQLEIVAGAPEAPVAGSLGIGARRSPDGRWQPVFGRNPATSTETYSWPDILDLVRGLGTGTAATPGPTLPGLTLLPGTSGLSPTLPGLPGTSITSGPTPQSSGATPMIPPLSEPRLDVSRAQQVVLDNFAVDHHNLSRSHQQILDGVALRLRIDDVRVVLVHGHTDTTGTEVHNEGLARRRAEAVRNALAERGIDADRLMTEGYGETAPAVSPERSATDRARNRRVELFWLRPAMTSPRLFRLGLGH